jgi:ABC-type transport system substrate-binding protein
MLPLPDARERATAVAAGRADIVSQFPSQYWEEGLRQPNVRLLSRQGLSAVLLGFSLRPGSPFADPRLRRVVALALDRDRIVREALQRLGTPLDQIVPPSVIGHSSSLPPFLHDPDAARALLEQLHLPNRPIELLVADAHQEVGMEVALQLQELGLPVKPTVLPQNDFYERWSREEFPLSVFGWSSTTGDASGSYEPLLHSPVEGFGRFNRFAYSNPRLDQLIELSDQAQKPEERREPLTTAARIVQADLPILPLALRYDLYAGRKDLDWRPRLDRRIRAFEVRPIQKSPER